MTDYSAKEIWGKILNLARCSPELLPPCFVSTQFSCERCSISQERECVLLRDPDFLSLLYWKIAHTTELTAPFDDDYSSTIIEVFESQGEQTALHIDKIFSLTQLQHPEMTISRIQLKNIIKENPGLFKEINSNVYTLVVGLISPQDALGDENEQNA